MTLGNSDRNPTSEPCLGGLLMNLISLYIYFFAHREFTIETEGKKFKLTKDMVAVKRFQKTVHGIDVTFLSLFSETDVVCVCM